MCSHNVNCGQTSVAEFPLDVTFMCFPLRATVGVANAGYVVTLPWPVTNSGCYNFADLVWYFIFAETER